MASLDRQGELRCRAGREEEQRSRVAISGVFSLCLLVSEGTDYHSLRQAVDSRSLHDINYIMAPSQSSSRLL